MQSDPVLKYRQYGTVTFITLKDISYHVFHLQGLQVQKTTTIVFVVLASTSASCFSLVHKQIQITTINDAQDRGSVLPAPGCNNYNNSTNKSQPLTVNATLWDWVFFCHFLSLYQCLSIWESKDSVRVGIKESSVPLASILQIPRWLRFSLNQGAFLRVNCTIKSVRISASKTQFTLIPTITIWQKQ